MPTYEYLCESCGHFFEAVQKITEDALTDCVSCGESSAKRQISATAFHLKGTGWYKTDYASGSSGGAPSAKGASSDQSGSDKSADKNTSKSESNSSDAKSGDSKSSDSKPAAASSSSKSESKKAS